MYKHWNSFLSHCKCDFLISILDDFLNPHVHSLVPIYWSDSALGFGKSPPVKQKLYRCGGQEHYNLPKTSLTAHFWGVWVVVLARGGANSWKWAVVLVSRVGWWWPEEDPIIKNEYYARFQCVWVVVVVVARGRPSHRKRAWLLVFGVCGWWWWPEEGPTNKNKCLHSFLEVVGGGEGQRKVQHPKTSGRAHFWGGAGKRKPNPQKWVFVLVFERCGWWCWPEEDPTPKNEHNSSFSGGFGWWWWWLSWRGQPAWKWVQTLVSRRPYPLITSMMARFRGLWVVVVR